MAVKITSKSKTAEHLLSYSAVSMVVNTLMGFSLLKYVYDQFNELVLTRLIALMNKFPMVLNLLTSVDAFANDKVLAAFDLALEIPVKYYTGLKSYANGVVKSANKYYFGWLNFYLPKSSKLSYPTNDNSLLETYDITNKFALAVKHLMVVNSNALSNYLISTYQQQYANDKTAGYTKRVVVLYKVSKTIADDVNKNYVNPSKIQTQDYVNDFTTQTKNKADTFISDAKQGIPNFINIKVTATNSASGPLAQTTEAPALVAPPVSASA